MIFALFEICGRRKKCFLLRGKNLQGWLTIVGPSRIYLDLPLGRIRRTGREKLSHPQPVEQEEESSKGGLFKRKNELPTSVVERPNVGGVVKKDTDGVAAEESPSVWSSPKCGGVR